LTIFADVKAESLFKLISYKCGRMAWPKVSIIWVNYNSSKIMSIALESLEAVSNFDYPADKYELIVVDNGSTDGSYEEIRNFLKRKSSLKKKLIRLNKNLGFTGGNNVGFNARDKESKYVVLLNNDAIPLQNSLTLMVEYAEQFNVDSLNGVILKYDSPRIIDTAGNFVDELVGARPIGVNERYPWIIRKPFYITYADGAYVIYKVSAIRRCMGEKLFFDEFFGYGDDNILGLMLWNHGYRVVTIPEIVAKHKRYSSFGSVFIEKQTPLNMYLERRSHAALLCLSNSRYHLPTLLYLLRNSLGVTAFKRGLNKCLLRSIVDGARLGKKLREKYGIFIDIYRGPVITIKAPDFFRYYIFGLKSSRKLHAFFREKIIKLVKSLEIT